MAAETFIEVEGLDRLVNRLGEVGGGVFTKQLMGEIATYLITAILQRTAKGIGAEGGPFKPYSPSYRYFREKTGHQGSPVNLFYSGGMLNSMTYKATKKKAEIFFANTTVAGQKTSNPEKAFYNQQSRNFFAISRQEQEKIREMVQDFVAKNI